MKKALKEELKEFKIEKKDFAKFEKGLYILVDKEYDTATVLDNMGNKALPLYEKDLVWAVDSLLRMGREARYGNKKALEDFSNWYCLQNRGYTEPAIGILEKYKLDTK